MANPPGLQYCKIYGNFKAFVADGGADGDDLPDFVPMTGYGEIYPNVEIARNTNMGFKSTYFNSPVSVTVDTDGDLSQGGRKYVMVLASSPDINPTGFNYTIRLTLTAAGESKERSYGPFAFDVIPGGEVDLTDVFPISASAGTPIIQGPQGEVGPVGPMGPVGAGIPAGGTALQLVRRKADNSTTEWVSPDKTLVGLGNVDNTSDANKPISTAQQTALNTKEPTIAAGTTAQYWRGDKTWQTLTKAAVGLSNVDNTSDVNKPVSSATQTALNLKLDSSQKAAASGVASLDSGSKLPYSQLTAAAMVSWQPNTSYALGQVVLSPGGNLIKSKVAHTSGTTYSGIGTNWANVVQGQGVVLNTNYMTNPAAYSVATGFGSYGIGTGEAGTQSFVTGANDGPITEITSYGRWSCTTAKTGGSTGWAGTASNYRAMVSGVSGNTYTTSLWLRYTGTGTVTTTLRMSYYDTNGVVVNSIDNTPVALASGVWTKLTVSGAATGTFASIGWWAFQTSGATVPSGTTLDATGIIVSAVGNAYFSGATTSAADITYAWTGTANASTSTQTSSSQGFAILDSSGKVDTSLLYATAAIANFSIINRDGFGRGKVNDPAAPSDIATKNYVDSIVNFHAEFTSASVTQNAAAGAACGALTADAAKTFNNDFCHISGSNIIIDRAGTYAIFNTYNPSSTPNNSHLWTTQNGTGLLSESRNSYYGSAAQSVGGFGYFAAGDTIGFGYTADITLNFTLRIRIQRL